MTQPPEDSQPARRLAVAVLLGVLTSALQSCGEQAETAAAAWRTIETPDGTALHLDAPPRRVVAASAGIAELLDALTDRSRIACIPDLVFDGWGTGFGSRADWEGQVLHAYRGEDVLGFRPDLVVAQTYQSEFTTGALNSAGVAVLCLPELREFQDLTRDIRLLGTALGESEKAESLVTALTDRVARLRAHGEGRRRVRVLSYSDYGTGAWAAGAECSADLMIRLAGMTNAGAESGRKRHYQIDRERLMDLAPDVILVGADARGRAPAADLLKADELTRQLEAVKRDRVVAVPAALWNSTSHRIVDAAEHLARAVSAALQR